MRYKLLGRSGLRVSELCLGTMTFGEAWGWGATKTDSKKMFDRFAEAGGNFIDTSVNYTDGESETILGDLLKADRDHFVVATKYTLTKPDSTDPNSGGNSRKNMMKSVERSLKRLQTDVIDLYYLHMWDYMTPVEEVMRGLDDLVQPGQGALRGVLRYPGLDFRRGEHPCGADGLVALRRHPGAILFIGPGGGARHPAGGETLGHGGAALGAARGRHPDRQIPR